MAIVIGVVCLASGAVQATEIDETFVAVKNAKWYSVEHEGTEAYVYSPLLQEKEARETAKREFEEVAGQRAEDETRSMAEAVAKRK